VTSKTEQPIKECWSNTRVLNIFSKQNRLNFRTCSPAPIVLCDRLHKLSQYISKKKQRHRCKRCMQPHQTNQENESYQKKPKNQVSRMKMSVANSTYENSSTVHNRITVFFSSHGGSSKCLQMICAVYWDRFMHRDKSEIRFKLTRKIQLISESGK